MVSQFHVRYIRFLLDGVMQRRLGFHLVERLAIESELYNQPILSKKLGDSGALLVTEMGALSVLKINHAPSKANAMKLIIRHSQGFTMEDRDSLERSR